MASSPAVSVTRSVQPFPPLGDEVHRVVTKYLTPELLEQRMAEHKRRQLEQERLLLEAIVDEVIEAACQSTVEERKKVVSIR